MKTFQKCLAWLLLTNAVIFIAGYLVINYTAVSFRLPDLAMLAISFSVITGLILFIFFRGKNKDQAALTMHILVAISLKLLLEMILALMWFVVAKKTTLTFVLLFFLLYLPFTAFSTFAMFNALKAKSL